MSFRSVAGAVFVDVWILEECKVRPACSCKCHCTCSPAPTCPSFPLVDMSHGKRKLQLSLGSTGGSHRPSDQGLRTLHLQFL